MTEETTTMLGVMRYIPILDFLPFEKVIIDTD